MAEDIVVRITGVDKMSPVLIKIGDSAEKAAADLKKAGADGKKAMADLESGAKKTDKEMRTFERTSLAVGATVGALALGLIRVSDAYKQQERQIAAVTRLYGDASQELLDYAETIQATTRFSNDAARESAILLNTLTQNYGLSTDQIETLIQRSTDLAQLHGRTLTEVSQMVSNALRGEGEYIEQIGVSMNQTFVAAEAAARGLANFTTEMTQAEQAAFRYQLFLEQTAAAQGYAMETADGTRGAIGLLINEFGDATQAAGDFIGPVADLAAEFSAYALWMPLIASQTARVSAILINAAKSGELATRSFAMLRAVTSPLGGPLLALVGVGTILGLKWLENRQDAEQLAEAMREVERTALDLREAIRNLSLTDLFGGRWAGQATIQVTNLIKDLKEVTEEEIDDLFTGESPLSAAFRKWMSEEELAPVGEEWERMVADLFLKSLAPTPQQEKELNEALTRFVSLGSVVGDITFDALQGQFQRLFDQLATRQITFDQFTDALNYMSEANEEAARSLEGVNIAQQELNASQAEALTLADSTLASEAYDEYTQSVNDATEAVEELSKAEKEHMELFRTLLAGERPDQDFTDFLDEQIDLINERKEAMKEAFLAERALREEMSQIARDDPGADATIEHLQQIAEEAAEVRKEILDTYNAAFGFDAPLAQINLSGWTDEFTQLAGAITNSGNALDTVFRVIVGNTNAIKDQAQGVHDWIDALTVAEDGVVRINQLLAMGLIDQGQWDAAVQAHDRIASAQIDIANNIDAIQAAQAPFMAQFVENQMVALRSLQGQSEEQQRITLGWMDSTTAAQAYTLVTQAAAVANGDLGEAGREAFHGMIEGAIAVNPFLFDMLESIGLINGTPIDFQVNFDGVQDGMSEIEMLTLRLEDLIRTLGGTLTDIPINISVDGLEDVSLAQSAIDVLLAASGSAIAMSLEVTDNTANGRGALGAGLSKLLGGGTVDPVVIPATIQWGDGTGGATADNSIAAAIPDDPIPVPVVPEVDTAAAEAAISGFASQEAVGPTFIFTQDSGEISAAVGIWTSAQFVGPTFVFDYNSDTLFEQVGIWAFARPSGPTFVFQNDGSELSAAVGIWRGATFDGPTFRFQADTSAVAAAVGQYAGRTVGTVYVNVQSRDMTKLFQHGGIPGFANGGVPAVLAEGNWPEVVHFANGGSAIAEREGLYMLPPQSLVVPSNNDRNPGRGGDRYYYINIEGSVTSETQLLQRFAEAMADEAERHEQSVGLAS